MSAATNEARLVVRNGELVSPVLGRVVGMLAARALCPVDKLDDMLLITDAISAHAGDYALNGTIGVTISTDDEGMTMLVSPLRPDGAQGLLAAADLPGVGNVLERVADEVTAGTHGDGPGEELRVRLVFQSS